MSQTMIAQRKVRKELPDRYAIEADVHLVHLTGNDRPYFSATGEVLNLRKRGDNAVETCGSIHEELLQHFPGIDVVVRVHLADDHGVPMHAIANGAYWLGFTQYKSADVRKSPDKGTEKADLPYFPYFASTWQVTEDEARAAYRYCLDYAHAENAGSEDHDERAFCASAREALEVLYLAMLPVWQGHADEALRYIHASA